MADSILIEVASKAELVDPIGQGLERTIRLVGLGKAKRVDFSQLYRLVGKVSQADLQKIGEQLLCDPVIQVWHDEAPKAKASPKGQGAKAKPMVIDVWYKPGVTDVVGESVAKGIRDLNIDGVETVRAGNRYRIWGLPNKAAAEKLGSALLANPLVQDQWIHVD